MCWSACVCSNTVLLTFRESILKLYLWDVCWSAYVYVVTLRSWHSGDFYALSSSSFLFPPRRLLFLLLCSWKQCASSALTYWITMPLIVTALSSYLVSFLPFWSITVGAVFVKPEPQTAPNEGIFFSPEPMHTAAGHAAADPWGRGSWSNLCRGALFFFCGGGGGGSAAIFIMFKRRCGVAALHCS